MRISTIGYVGKQGIWIIFLDSRKLSVHHKNCRGRRRYYGFL